jgi:hypothetical protein
MFSGENKPGKNNTIVYIYIYIYMYLQIAINPLKQ